MTSASLLSTLKSSTNYNYLPVDRRGQTTARARFESDCRLSRQAVWISRGRFLLRQGGRHSTPAPPVRTCAPSTLCSRGESHPLHISSALGRTASRSHMTVGNFCKHTTPRDLHTSGAADRYTHAQKASAFFVPPVDRKQQLWILSAINCQVAQASTGLSSLIHISVLGKADV